MQKFLTLSLPLKQDAASQEAITEFTKDFDKLPAFKIVKEALDESESVHFAQFVVLDNKYIQIITTFDGDDRDYAIFFFEKLQKVYERIYKFVEGAPIGVKFNLDNYLSFNSAHRPSPFFTYSAYEDLSVTEIKTLEGDGKSSTQDAARAHGSSQDVIPQAQSAIGSPGEPPPMKSAITIKEGDSKEVEVTPDLNNVQGLIVKPYKHEFSRHLLLQINDASKGRELLRSLHPLVTTASDWGPQKPPRLLNLSVTYTGLKALDVDDAILRGQTFTSANKNQFSRNSFPPEFIQFGEKKPELFEYVGFTGRSAPGEWWKGSKTPIDPADVHMILHLYANEASELDKFTDEIRGLFSDPIKELRPFADGGTIDGRRRPDGKDHFGYKDGISQPSVNWTASEVDKLDPNFSDFREFLLGYSDGDLTKFQSSPTGSFAKDGSFLVFQLLHQDVAAFNALLKAGANHSGIPKEVVNKEEWIAAKMIGRWRNGVPLVEDPVGEKLNNAERDPSSKTVGNDFNYGDDPNGVSCPFSAHIRVANPRDQKIRPISGPVPRLIRRGMPFGAPYNGDEKEPVDRGMVGMFICANIERQYIKLARWINRNDFSSVFTDESAQDPVQGNRDVRQGPLNFNIPIDPTAGKNAIELMDLPSLITTRGAAFCFLPSLSAIADLGAGNDKKK